MGLLSLGAFASTGCWVLLFHPGLSADIWVDIALGNVLSMLEKNTYPFFYR
jgi:hypothetical protein